MTEGDQRDTTTFFVFDRKYCSRSVQISTNTSRGLSTIAELRIMSVLQFAANNKGTLSYHVQVFHF